MQHFIRIWYTSQWCMVRVLDVKHDTVEVEEPDHPHVGLTVSRATINPLDLPTVPLPSCRFRFNSEDKWEWVTVLTIAREVIVNLGDGRATRLGRHHIHPDDNKLMPLPPL